MNSYLSKIHATQTKQLETASEQLRAMLNLSENIAGLRKDFRDFTAALDTEAQGPAPVQLFGSTSR